MLSTIIQVGYKIKLSNTKKILEPPKTVLTALAFSFGPNDTPKKYPTSFVNN
jgi:hypothetical protein